MGRGGGERKGKVCKTFGMKTSFLRVFRCGAKEIWEKGWVIPYDTSHSVFG